MKNQIHIEKKYCSPILILLGLMVVFATSCSKDDGVHPPDEITFVAPTAAEFDNLRQIALAQLTETAVFNAEDGIIFISDDGAQLEILPGCLTQNGDLVNGEVELTFIDIYDAHNMASTNKPTMGLKPNGDKAMLITGGEFFIEVRKDGILLDTNCPHRLVVPGDNTGGVDPEMILWDGIIDEKGDLTWDPIDPEDDNRAGLFVEGDSYYAFTHNFGWTNIDKFYNDPREKTTMQAKVPEGFDYGNSALYISYDGEPNALAQLDTYDPETGIFSEHYGQIPIGLEVHIIFVSADGDDYRYAIQGVTIEENAVYEFTMEDTQTGTQQDWEAAIEALP